MTRNGLPQQQGLYDPRVEHDSCGVGFIVNMKGERSHGIVRQALDLLVNLDHRGGCGCEPNTGDGAGIMMQIPDPFLRRVLAPLGLQLPPPSHYGVGMIFTSKAPAERDRALQTIEGIVAREGQRVIGWRDIPTENATLGRTALAGEPFMRQLFIERGADCPDQQAFERKLYLIRKRSVVEIRRSGMDPYWYVPSLSSRTMVYKGMLTTGQLEPYYPDLGDPALESALALVHSRFSTNTFPIWDRSHPYRLLAHNGEINTLRGNINWMHARQKRLACALFGADFEKVQPIINTNGSDSAMFDNFLELLVMAGRPLPHAIMMMIPEPWENHESMSPKLRAFYQYHACLMEPWDGPAALAFTDGRYIGAVLDRNGLRPLRYCVTSDGLVIMASEAGVLPVEPERILQKGRVQPGRMFLVDLDQGRIVPDHEIKEQLASEKPYAEWLEDNQLPLAELPQPAGEPLREQTPLIQRQQALGYSFEDLRVILEPMARDGVQPLGSMGSDTPLAVLSDRPQLLYNYFKQLFAQVTNPPIDPIREELITSTTTLLGSEENLLEPTPQSARLVRLEQPFLTDSELEKLRGIDWSGFSSQTLSLLFPAGGGPGSLEKALDLLFKAADAAVAKGHNILILSDRGISRQNAAIPALLALSGLHHHLIRKGSRTRVGLVVESGEPREVHHFATLIGYGANAINPYLAYETLDDMIGQGMLAGIDPATAQQHFIKACVKGVVKTMAKMGISTIQSYRGAQIFEAVGLHNSVIERYFTWTASRIEGMTLEGIETELMNRHSRAFPLRAPRRPTLDPGGSYQWRKEGEEHLFNPLSIHALQKAARGNDYAQFKVFSSLINDQAVKHCTLRGMLAFRQAEAIPIDEVEPVEKIVRRFKTGAMSYGSISKEVHETLAIAMNRIGGMSNTGEGGEDPERYSWTNEAGDSKNSAIKQVASARFGVTSLYLTSARELQIKMAQGAKPGEGGELPGLKVHPWIARTRHTTPGVGLISPPPHHDIYSIEDLAELIHDLKNANRRARISVKLVSEAGVGTVAAGVAKAHADVVLISGYDGGTGASPLSSIRHAGLPWELGLAETHQTLMLNGLRSRIAVETDGQLKTGRDVAIAALLGAEEFGFATAPLVTLGCLMMRVCHLNTCPVGVATQDPRLRGNFTGRPEHVVNFMKFVAQELREIMAQLGFRELNQMIGRTDLLEPRGAIEHWKAKGLDLSRLLYQPLQDPEVNRYCVHEQDHNLESSLDHTVLLELCEPAIERGERVSAELDIRNVHRVVGTMVGSEITRRHGAAGLPEDTVQLRFRGSAGQSFGAFIPKGVTLELEGDANDYLGKGLSGGKIVLYPPREAGFAAHENIITGNVACYGATGGEIYIRGMAGERFCVRNSGVAAVVEAVGDHGCEYMTGGTVVVLGPTGRNFAAGMSGGIAYVLDEAGDFPSRCNKQMVFLEELTEEDAKVLKEMIERHAGLTGSVRGAEILADWERYLPGFVKVMPKDYKRVLKALAKARDAGLSGDEAMEAAFEENLHDATRVGGG
ncbi:MAG: glutamate synthase subunit alpha [Geobacteraceae bacterium GWC2_58_44]|nr:MAG: glutamate synthase subunit alpha [Geobacteraceae bacterium GWC2_58_44]HBG04436.1 glutamate synthase large subunit [Geobacter sp.]